MFTFYAPQKLPTVSRTFACKSTSSAIVCPIDRPHPHEIEVGPCGCRNAALASRCHSLCCPVQSASLLSRASPAEGTGTTSPALTVIRTGNRQCAAGRHSVQPVPDATGCCRCLSLVSESSHLHRRPSRLCKTALDIISAGRPHALATWFCICAFSGLVADAQHS